PGPDYIQSGPGDDRLFGGQGDDHFIANRGDDRIHGGPERHEGLSDAIEFRKSAGDARVDLASGIARGRGRDRLGEIEDVYSARGDDTINGNGDDNQVFSGAGNDVIAAGGGGDWVLSSPGIDMIGGGAGDDHLYAPVVSRGPVYGGPGMDLLHRVRHVNLRKDIARRGKLNLRGIEGATGSSVRDIFLGDDEKNVFEGDLGSDVLDGRGGDDELGGPYEFGIDFITGGEGDDVIEGGPNADSLYGKEGDDTIFGDSPTTAEQSSGDDYLNGGTGFDLLDGGFGRDECRRAEQRVNCEVPRF
ncbi:MAG: hypothetical protein M3285_13475, partial [Actinomycetota bacterium]|nr:hypothetical protein [Actinomycetota bacterium]